MSLPMLKKCCGCLSIEIGCFLLCVISILLCVADIAVGSWNLPRHRSRAPEDNLISMSMVMFSSLSALSDASVLLGMCAKRPGFLKLSLLFNSVFILCIFLVAVVTLLFSYELRPFLESGGNVAFSVAMIFLGAAFSAYYLLVVNSMYRKMKSDYGDSAIPV